MNAHILLNSTAGSAADRRSVEQALADARIDGEIQWLEPHRIPVAASAAVEAGAELIVAGGGDGTISSVAGVVAGGPAALGILPLGTLNHFARDLGIPFDLAQAAKLIESGVHRRVDIAELNGRTFVNNSAIGLYPLMVVDRDLQRRRLGRSKRLAMLVASIRTLLRFNHQRLILTVNDQDARVDTPLLFVGNNDYRLDIGGPGQRESLEDGKLFVLVMRSKSRSGFVAATFRALLGRARRDDMVQLEGVERLQVSSHKRHLVASLDGEVVRMGPPLDYRIRPRALKVIAP